MFKKVAGNGHGLAMWWNLKIVSPEPRPNKNTKDEANKQKPNRITSAETAADSDKMMKLTTSSHHIAKPPVIRIPLETSVKNFKSAVEFISNVIYFFFVKLTVNFYETNKLIFKSNRKVKVDVDYFICMMAILTFNS
jgi:hypothetical protein